MVGLRGFALALIVLLGVAAQASAGAESGAQDQATTSASAYGLKVLLPNQLPIVAGLVDGAATQAASPVAFAYPEDGSIVRAESVAGRSWATRVNAQARADLRLVSLFGGEVTVGAVVARTLASTRTGEESFSGTSVTSLTVLGQSIAPAPDLRVPLADWGHLTLLQQRTAGESTHRGWVTAVDVRLDADHAGLPVGTRILVGYAEASATVPQPTVAKPVVTESAKPSAALPPTIAAPTERPASRRGLGIPSDMARPGTTGPSPLVQIAPKVTKRLTAAGYVFPVYGPSGFGDTFGAARATTIWHHGQDLFARSVRRCWPWPTARSSRSDGTVSAATGCGFATVAATSSTTRIWRVLAARSRRWTRARRRRRRIRRQHRRRGDHAVPPALRDPPVVVALPGLRRRRQSVSLPPSLATRGRCRLSVGGRMGSDVARDRPSAGRRRRASAVDGHLGRQRARPGSLARAIAPTAGGRSVARELQRSLRKR